MTRRRWPRVLLYVFGTLVVLIGVLYAFASYRIGQARAKRYDLAAATLPAADSTSLARGEHLTNVLGCATCHGDDFGGQLLADAPPFRLEPVNLTRGTGGVGAQLTPVKFEQAVRQGVGHDGRGMIVMPTYENMADADVVALHAYIASRAPVDRQMNGVVVKPLGKMIFGLGGVPFEADRLDHARTFAPAPPADSTTAYGDYFAHLTCVHCHGADLRGMQPPDPGSPPAPSLEPASRWSEAQFDTAMRTGRRPSGPAMDSVFMPWKDFARLNGGEMKAIRSYLEQHFGGAPPAPTAAR